MSELTVLFLNCTQKRSPEISNTEALWDLVASLYQQQGFYTHQLRVVDCLPTLTAHLGSELVTQNNAWNDSEKTLDQAIQQSNIIVIGVPVKQGAGSPSYQKLIEYLRHSSDVNADPVTGQPMFYNKVLGVLTVNDASGGRHPIAQILDDFSQLGITSAPQNTVAWLQPMDTTTGFIEANGKDSATVNREAQLVVDNTIAIAKLLQRSPLKTNLYDISQSARAIAKAANPETPTLLTPKTVCLEEPLDGEGIHYSRLTKRIWTVMQEGQRRGFEFKVLSLEDRIFRAERNGQGFIYKIYPGQYSFRKPYDDYDYEQSKSRKLSLMEKHDLPVPISYGIYKTVMDIPWDQLSYPIVAKPNSGSLSQNVFPNLQTPEQLKQAASIIEASGGEIKLESHILGRDYRVLIVNHQYAGCVERRPANVVGDGIHTILELFHLRNQEPGRGDRYEAHTTIHQLVFDQTSQYLLDQAGYTLQTVLPEGEMFYIQTKITAATGSDYVDCTDQLHPIIIQDCIDFSHQFSTLTLGFDLITTDISRPLEETKGAFNEYNFIPYVDLHENCNIGQKRPVCRLIWDYIEDNADKIITSEFQPF